MYSYQLNNVDEVLVSEHGTMCHCTPYISVKTMLYVYHTIYISNTLWLKCEHDDSMIF